MHYTPYALPSITSALITFTLFIYVSLFRRRSNVARHFLALMGCFITWAFAYAMVLINTDFNHKLFGFNLAQIGPDFAPIFWLLLA